MAENNSSATLLPCPFCGAAARGYEIEPHQHSAALLALVPNMPKEHQGSYAIEGECSCGSGLIGDNRAEVTARWNARAPQAVAAQAAPAAVAVPASWADSEDDKPTSRADLERVLDEWNDTTGALPRDSGWRAEVLGMLHDAYDLGAHQSGNEAKALAALRYYNSECTGQEPSLSVFQQMVDEALAAAPAEVQADPVAWLPVAGFEDAYEVSSSGDIRNAVTGNILAKNLMGSGYVKANLWSEGKRKQTSVHRVVAQAFIPNPNDLAEVNHIDGDKTNNTIENLEWSDRQSNNNHALYGLGKRTKPVIAVDPESGEETYFPSINAAGRCGYNASGIYNVLNGLMHTHKGKHWAYTEWRTPGGTAPQAQPADALDARRGGKWLTVVYRDVQPGDEAREIGSHQKVAALSWSHALDDRDAAMAAAQEGGNAAKEA